MSQRINVIDKSTAIQIAQKYIDEHLNVHRSPENLFLKTSDDLVIEKPYGYVILYQSQEYLATKNRSYMIYGTKPFIISKENGLVIEFLPTNQSIEVSLSEFEEKIGYHS